MTKKLAFDFCRLGQTPEGERLSCGCCRGPEEDRCCCWNHQDRPRGILPKICSRHREPAPAAKPKKKHTNYRVTVQHDWLPGREFVVTRRSTHADYRYVWLSWPLVHMGKYGPSVGFTRERKAAEETMRRCSGLDPSLVVRVVQEILPADKS